ncbi:MAG: beta-lactamase family protein [Planctomycetes bacterium]|nr:beta-lactamase family protein [Planctomycetota bacterium]
MQSSGYAHEDVVIPHRARGYAVVDGKLVPARWMNMEVPRGAGALGSTVNDLLIWARALPGLDVVGDASFAAMVEPTALPVPGRDGSFDVVRYGLGLMTGERDGVAWYGHGGNIEGFNTWIEWLPDHDLALVALVNTEGDHARALCDRLARMLAPARAAGSAR